MEMSVILHWYVSIQKMLIVLQSRLHSFNLVENAFYEIQAIGVRNNPSLGILIEGEVTAPPCSDPETVKQFKIEPICDLIKTVSRQKEAFLKLMKFTKQSPVFMEEDDEYNSVFSNMVSAKFGYSLKKNIEV